MKFAASAAAVVLAWLAVLPARADTLGAGIVSGLLYQQTAPTAVVPDAGANALFEIFLSSVTGSSDFNGGYVTYPGHSSPQFLINQTGVPYFEAGYFSYFPTAASMSAAFPSGTYDITATSSKTNASQTVSLYYSNQQSPASIPQLTAGGYGALQTAHANQVLTLNFNTFVPASTLTSVTSLSFQDLTTGKLVNLDPACLCPSSSLAVSPSATSASVPAGVFVAGHKYLMELSFQNSTYDSPHTFTSGFVGTTADFTMGAGGSVVTVPGGPKASPAKLSVSGPVAVIDDDLSPGADEKFYEFHWRGGAFYGNMSIKFPGGIASNESYYYIEMFNMDGSGVPILNGGLTAIQNALNSQDGFTDYFGAAGGPGVNLIDGLYYDYCNSAYQGCGLAAGNYEIGIVGSTSIDPDMTIDFASPVYAVSVPEPAQWAMIIGGLGLIGCAKRVGRRSRCA